MIKFIRKCWRKIHPRKWSKYSEAFNLNSDKQRNKALDALKKEMMEYK